MGRKNPLGLVHLYTGNGKGKTTAALGQALRAAGHGYRVVVIQFMKGRTYGELKSAKKIRNLTIRQFGTDEFVYKGSLKKRDIELAQKGLQFARKAATGGEYDIVVLDEVSVAADFGLVDAKEVLDIVKNRRAHVEMILTGRNAPQELMEIADLVTEMREVRHPYQKGIECRKGIEW